jgi:hypothetical protein
LEVALGCSTSFLQLNKQIEINKIIIFLIL